MHLLVTGAFVAHLGMGNRFNYILIELRKSNQPEALKIAYTRKMRANVWK